VNEDPRSPEHLSSRQLAAYLSGGLEVTARASVADHLTECAECRSEASAVTRIVTAEQRARTLKRVVFLTAGAAALLAVVVAVRPTGSPGEGMTRGGPPSEVAAVAPLGEVSPTAGPVSFVWHAVPSVREYSLMLTDAGGQVLWTRRAPDTVLTLPLEVSLPRGGTYYWRVDALLSDGRSLTTSSQEFRITR
jgi:hypothetical protein